MVQGIFNSYVKGHFVAIDYAVVDVEPLFFFAWPARAGQFLSILSKDQEDRLGLCFSGCVLDRYGARPLAGRRARSGGHSRKQEAENYREKHKCLHDLVLQHPFVPPKALYATSQNIREITWVTRSSRLVR